MCMEVRQCKKCGRLFQYTSGLVCPECSEKIDRDFVLVRDYLYKHEQADIKEISENTGVEEKQILVFLKEERLSIAKTSKLLTCDRCGQPITTGRYCKKCLETLNQLLEATLPPEQKAKAQKKTSEQWENTSKSQKLYLDYSKRG